MDPADHVRIITTNGAAFMMLRDDHLVAGLSDSVRRLVRREMKSEMSKGSSESEIGRMIEGAVKNGVEKFLSKEIELPLKEVRDIRYDDRKIVIDYRGGKPRGMINFETIKIDNDQTLLEQFSERDAKRLVRAVRVRMQQP